MELENQIDTSISTSISEELSNENSNDESLGDNGKKALQDERKLRKTFEKKVKELEAKFNGIDIEQYNELLNFKLQQETLKQQEEVKALESQQEYQKALEKLKTDFEKKEQELLLKLQEKESTIQKTSSEFVSTIIQRDLLEGLAKNNCLDPGLILDKYTNQLTLDGQKVKVLDEQGMISDVSLDDFIKSKIKPNHPYLFKSDIPNGTGVIPGSGQSKPITTQLDPKDFLKMSGSSAIAVARKQNK